MNCVGRLRAFDVSTESDVGTISDMAESVASPQARADYWNAVHDGADEKTRSWYQSQSVMTFQLLDELGVPSNASVIDVGGGASSLVDQLLAKHFTDITVLDVSSEAIGAAQRRVGADPHVTWLVDDLLTWTSDRRYDVWHDRAVFHFMSGDQIDVYRSLLHRILAAHGAVILATFAPDGPDHCSGLPVQRYGPEELVDVLGSSFEMVTSIDEVHTTPGGAEQPFTWIGARRRDEI